MAIPDKRKGDWCYVDRYIDRLAEMLYEVMDDIPQIIHSLGYVKIYQHVDD